MIILSDSFFIKKPSNAEIYYVMAEYKAPI